MRQTHSKTAQSSAKKIPLEDALNNLGMARYEKNVLKKIINCDDSLVYRYDLKIKQ